MDLTLIICVVLFTVAIRLFMKWANQNRNYFADRKILYMKPRFLVGNTFGLFVKKYRPDEFMTNLYNRFPNEKVFGFFDMRAPTYYARDVELIRQMAVKDFDHFEDHVSFIDAKSDSLFGNSLFMLEGDKWRDMRATLSPSFTGSKMRQMFDLIIECAADMSKHLANSKSSSTPIRWEMKELFSRYTSDVIASCAFGLKVNSLEDKTNEFYTIGRKSMDFGSTKVALRLLIIRLLPRLMRAIDFELFPAAAKRFFSSMVLETMQVRNERNIVRTDMINILMQVRNGGLKHHHDEKSVPEDGFAVVQESDIGKKQVKREWTDDEIVAQCFIFFAAGFDTVSTLLSFLAYELAVNPDIQQKLFIEIDSINSSLNGAPLNYDTLSKMKYMDQVISETLRKWPPAIFTNRLCTKEYACELDGNKFRIEKGKVVWIPIHAIHKDPKYYPSPETFDPERFSDENKHQIVPGSFLPFGVGPRNCIGSRFALMEIKAIIYYILTGFTIKPYAKTQIPVKIEKSAANWVTQINLEFEPRKSKPE